MPGGFRAAAWATCGLPGPHSRQNGRRHGLRRLRAQAIRAAHAGTGDGVTGAGGVVGDDRRTRRQKAGDGQAHLLPGAPEESRTRRQNGGRGSSPGLCYCWWGAVSGSCTRWACLLNHVFLLMVSPQALAPGGRTTVPARGAVTERPQVARVVGMASLRYQVQKALRAGTSVCSAGCQFRAPAAALAQL